MGCQEWYTGLYQNDAALAALLQDRCSLVYVLDPTIWPRFNIQLRPAIVLADADERVFFRQVGKLTGPDLKARIGEGLKWLRAPKRSAQEDPFAEIVELLGRGENKKTVLALQKFEAAYRKPADLGALPAAAVESRIRAIEMMGDLQHPAIASLLLRVLREDPNDHARSAGGRALAVCALPSDVPALMTTYRDASVVWIVQAAALEAVGGVIDRFGLVKETEAAVRDLAATAAADKKATSFLGRLRWRPVVPALQEALKRDSDTARANEGFAAVQALGRIGDPKAAPALKEAQIRDTPDATQRLDFPALRQLAAEAAGARALCGDLTAVDDLIAMLEWPEYDGFARPRLATLSGVDLGKTPAESVRLYREWWEQHRDLPRELWLLRSFQQDARPEDLARSETLLLLEPALASDVDDPGHQAAGSLIRRAAGDAVMVEPARWLEQNRPYLYWHARAKGGPVLTVDAGARARRQATANAAKAFR